MKLYLTENDRNILFKILAKYKDDFEFFAFGSRVKGSHKKYSDLDLAIIKKSDKELATLKNELDDSNLAITIDIVDYSQVSPDFKKLIEKQKIPISL